MRNILFRFCLQHLSESKVYIQFFPLTFHFLKKIHNICYHFTATFCAIMLFLKICMCFNITSLCYLYILFFYSSTVAYQLSQNIIVNLALSQRLLLLHAAIPLSKILNHLWSGILLVIYVLSLCFFMLCCFYSS